MRAQVGDHLLVEGPKVGSHRRDGEIVEVHGKDGSPPFVVRWTDTGTQTLVYPGPDSRVTPASEVPTV